MNKYHKYPRTRHAPWSRSKTDDDKVHPTMKQFEGQHVIVTEKMDGENTTMYSDNIHARSIDSRNHPSRNWVKQLHGEIAHMIPEGMRVCGENMYAKHSIAYDDLSSFFLVFNIWDGDLCLSWKDTLEWCELLGLDHVRVLYNDTYDEEAVRSLWTPNDADDIEGYVIRFSGEVRRSEFSDKFAKFVRKGHVQTDEHWMFKEVESNKLRE